MDPNNSMFESLKTTFEKSMQLKDDPEDKPTPPGAGAAGDSNNLFDLYKAEGNALVKSERYVEALLKYEKAWEACEADDDRAMILNNRGVVYEKLGETERALEIFTEALTLKPAYLKVLVRRALIYKKLKDYDKAIEDLSEAQALSMRDDQQVTGLVESISELFKEYVDDELDKDRAKREFGFPKDLYVEHYFRGFYCDPVSAMWRSSAALEDSSDEPSPFVQAMNLMRAKEYSKLSEYCTAEIERNGMYKLDALNLRGSMEFLKGNHEAAVADFKAITEDESATDECKSSAHLKAAVCQNLWSTSDEAAYHFAESEKLWKQNADVYYHASVCLVDRGEGIPANALLEKGVQECPDPKQHPLLHVLRLSMQSSFDACIHGNVSSEEILGKLKDLESLFDNPDCYEIAAQAFILLSESGDEAEEMFEKAVQLSGGCGLYKLKKVMAKLMKCDDRDAALMVLEEQAQDPDIASIAYYHIAEIYMMMQNFEEAMKYVDKSLEAAPSIYDVKMRLLSKIDFKYNARVAEKLKFYKVDLFGRQDEDSKALE